MRQSQIIFSLCLWLFACDHACKVSADCVAGDACAVNLGLCRKLCTRPIDCTGSTSCTALGTGQSACLGANEAAKVPAVENTDTSLGMLCAAPQNNGVSAAVDGYSVCGPNAATCTKAFGSSDASDINLTTCTSECSADADCAAKAPPGCIGDCLTNFSNLCCLPDIPFNSKPQYFGNTKAADGSTLQAYCRPRFLCYFVPSRCTQDTQCGSAKSRAGAACTKTNDGGGACISGKLGLYECCQRAGECDQAPGGNAAKGLSCQPSLDNLSGVCTRPCTSDADCQTSAAPTASCWTTTFTPSDVSGQCLVTTNPAPICRNQPKPLVPNPANTLVPCDTADRPISLPDNHYDASLRRCVRTF